MATLGLKKSKVTDGCVTPWTTITERKSLSSSQNWVYSEMVSRLTVNQLFRVRAPVDPRSPDTTGNPHSHMAAGPLTR